MKSVFIKALIACGFVFMLLWMLTEEAQQSLPADEQSTTTAVSAIQVKPQAIPFTVMATGLTQTHWPTLIVAAFSGRVHNLSLTTEPGDLVQADQVLVNVIDTAYQAQVRSAEARVAQAELALSRNQHEQQVKKSTTKGLATNDFGLLIPHVKAAKAELSAAKAALSQAQQQLDETLVKAPFAAIILDKKISPGQWINHGDVLFSLAASDLLDVEVALAASQWAQLEQLAVGSEVQVLAPNGDLWPGHIRYLSPVMDPTTRQRNLMISVAEPYIGSHPLLAGQQVMVKFTGPIQQDVVVAPASALTQDGHVWSVVDGALKLEHIHLLDEQPDHVIFRYQHSPTSERSLVIYPLSTMITGQKALAEYVNWQPGESL